MSGGGANMLAGMHHFERSQPPLVMSEIRAALIDRVHWAQRGT
jgi:hypothetical protein